MCGLDRFLMDFICRRGHLWPIHRAGSTGRPPREPPSSDVLTKILRPPQQVRQPARAKQTSGGFFCAPLRAVFYNRGRMASDPFIDRSVSRVLPQFGLRTLFLVVTYLAVVFGLMGAIGPIASAALLLLLAMIALHVAGNVLGTRLRDETSAHVLAHQTSPTHARLRSKRHRRARSRLTERTPLGWLIRAACVAGSLTGAAIGKLTFEQFPNATLPDLIVGTISFAILGGLLGFLVGGFLKMTLRAWWQAVCDSRLDACQPESIISRK